ncbi:uncharacterized protein LOC144450910 [Glandiceps talaboti]
MYRWMSNKEQQKALEEMEMKNRDLEKKLEEKEEKEEMRKKEAMKVGDLEKIQKCEDRIKKTVAAYRCSYRLMGRTNIGLNITKGVLVSTAFAAVIPAVPIAVAIVPIASAIIEIIQNTTSLAKKREKYKSIYKQYRQLLTLIRYRGASVDLTKLLKDVAAKEYDIIELDIYSPPLDRYMTKYKLDPLDKTYLET